MSDEKKNTTHYELPTGAVAILHEILATPSWYKDDPKQAKTIVHAVGALDALPEPANRPQPQKDESRDDFDARADVWAKPVLEFEWADKHKEAVRKCVAHFLKQGAFAVNHNTVALLTLLGLDD